jgi:hypothetical protein
MMGKRLLSLAMALFALAATAADTASEKLPVRRVVLYKNGVGYFEHTGRVRGAQELKIDFTSAQLNDVLKSLTVLDLNGGKISGVGYNSVAPIAEQLKALRLPLDESTTLAGFLNALRGSQVEVRNDSAMTSGRLLSVEEKTTHKGKDEAETVKTLEISLVTAAGEVRTFSLTSAVTVRVADHDLNEEISKYLTLVSSARDQDLRQMSISTNGEGERSVFVSYISEVPVWKSTYRILLPTKADASPLLQGWAIVDNTVGEDWKDVELSLVAGAPQSFIQELSKPYYTRRPVVALPETAMLTPQTHEGTMEEEASPRVAFGAIAAPPPLAPTSPGVVGGIIGGVPGANAAVVHKIVTKSGNTSSFGGALSVAEAEEKAAESLEPAANGQELGDLFQYNLKERVTILKNHSALVPIINSHIKAEKVTLWSNGSARPLRALWVTNSSGLTLDGGAFNVIEENAFAGEGIIDPLKPEERRLLSYAVDQAVRVDHKGDLEVRPITHIKIAKGVMVQTSEQRDHQKYTIRNTDTQARDVVIEHPLRAGWKLADSLKPEETSTSFYRFRVKVEPNKTAELKVDEVQPLETRIALSSVTDDQVRIWFNDKTIKPELEQALRRIIEQKNKIAAVDQQIQAKQTLITSVNQDQQRLRENMKALKGSAEEKALLQRYTHELNAQEDKLQAARAEIDGLAVKKAEGKAQLDKLLQDLTLDQTI